VQVTCSLDERNIHALNLARAAWIFLLVFLGIYVIKEILKVGIHLGLDADHDTIRGPVVQLLTCYLLCTIP
jgi:hypothetical protein